MEAEGRPACLWALGCLMGGGRGRVSLDLAEPKGERKVVHEGQEPGR